MVLLIEGYQDRSDRLMQKLGWAVSLLMNATGNFEEWITPEVVLGKEPLGSETKKTIQTPEDCAAEWQAIKNMFESAGVEVGSSTPTEPAQVDLNDLRGKLSNWHNRKQLSG